MKNFIEAPWGRIACVAGAVLGFSLLESDPENAVRALAVFVFAGIALHCLAIWKDKS